MEQKRARRSLVWDSVAAQILRKRRDHFANNGTIGDLPDHIRNTTCPPKISKSHTIEENLMV